MEKFQVQDVVTPLRKENIMVTGKKLQGTDQYEVKFTYFGDNPFVKYGKEIITVNGKGSHDKVRKIFNRKHGQRYQIISISHC